MNKLKQVGLGVLVAALAGCGTTVQRPTQYQEASHLMNATINYKINEKSDFDKKDFDVAKIMLRNGRMGLNVTFNQMKTDEFEGMYDLIEGKNLEVQKDMNGARLALKESLRAITAPISLIGRLDNDPNTINAAYKIVSAVKESYNFKE